MELDFSERIKSLFESSAKRSGPKSGAQTPAPKSDQKTVSDKNKKGSAGEDGGKIEFTEKITNSLQEKAKTHKRPERIGQPGYRIVRQKDADTNQRSLLFELEFPELILNKSGKPKFRIMSSFE